MPQNPHRAGRYGWRVWLSILILGLFAVPAALLYENIFDSGTPQSLSGATSLSPPEDNFYGNPNLVYSPAGSYFCVTFEFLGVNSAASQVNFGILIALTAYGEQNRKKLGPHPSLRISSYSGLSSITIPFPLADLTGIPGTNCIKDVGPGYLDQHAGFRYGENISVLGQPRAFPNDWYELNDRAFVVDGTSAPLPTSILLMSRDQDLSLRVDPDNSGFPYRLEFVIKRHQLVVFYSYFLACLPFILLVALLSKLAYRREDPDTNQIAFGVAATMIAILTLRSVLVPSAISDLTRIDFVFGTEVAALVALSVLWVNVWAPVLTRPAAADPAATVPGRDGPASVV
jgi:hypothetical protein